jgi:thiol-disulfide isomerase/thioredoxin
MMRRPLVVLTCFAALALAGTDAGADLFKCVGADGKVAYQAEPCAAAAAEKRIRTTAEAGEIGPNGVELLDVGQTARRIAGQRGRPSVVLLYATNCPLTRQMFPQFVAIANRYRARGVDFLVFSTDDEENIALVPTFLSERHAPFPALAIKPWPAGSLDRAMKPLGIEIGETFTRPVIAVRDGNGKIITQGQGITDLSPLQSALNSLVR